MYVRIISASQYKFSISITIDTSPIVKTKDEILSVFSKRENVSQNVGIMAIRVTKCTKIIAVKVNRYISVSHLPQPSKISRAIKNGFDS